MTSGIEGQTSRGTVPEPGAGPAGYRVGDLLLDVRGRWVRRGETELALQPLSFDLLLALVRRAPEPVPVRSLMKEVWPKLVVGPETVSQRVKLLRAALGDDADQPRYIAGIRGKGYRVVAPVSRVSLVTAPESAAAVGAVAPLDGAAASSDPESTPAIAAGSSHSGVSRGAFFRSRAGLAVAAAVLAVLLTSAWLFVRGPEQPARSDISNARSDRSGSTLSHRSSSRPSDGSRDGPSALPAAREIRLAVLPLENLSPDPGDAFFAAGMHEEIIGALARLPGIKVVSRTTMLTYRDAPAKPVATIAQESGATHVIEGSVRREAQRVRLSIQLIEARTDEHLWAQTYDRMLESALTLQAEIASDVASKLAVRLPNGRAPAKPLTANAEAFDLYLQGLHARAGAMMTFSSEEAIRAVEAPLARAVELDPDFAAAQAELAMAHLGTFAVNLDTGERQLELARQALVRAERVAPNDPKVLAVRAMYAHWFEGDIPGAVAGFEAAEAAGLADPLWLQAVPDLLVALSRKDDALEMSRRSLAMDPLNASVVTLHAIRLAQLHAPAEALRILDRAIPEFRGLTVLPILREQIYFWHTGDMAPFLAQVNAHGYGVGFSTSTGVDAAEALRREAETLRYSGKLNELRKLLDAYPHARLRSRYLGAGEEPLAQMRGWASLLVGNREAAARAGREILKFLSDSPETTWNRDHRLLLLAQAHAFLGDHERALAAARSLNSPSPGCVGACRIHFQGTRAAIFAWSGAEEDAVQQLEALATGDPSPGPALIAKDPLYTIPLQSSANFQKLVSRLDARMLEVKKELGRLGTSVQ